MNRDNTNGKSAENDNDLVQAYNNGKHAAFEEIVIRYQNRVISLCYRFLGDTQEAEDTAQEVFIKVFKGLKRFRLESSLFTWIYKITVNTCKNRIKSLDYRHSQKMTALEDENKNEYLPSSGLVDNRSIPDEVIGEKERMVKIQKAINELPYDQKTVVILRDVEGLSYEEIANVTGRRIGTVKSKLSRARFSLRDKLKGIV